MKDNKTFCILPFVHVHLNTDGNVRPCCTSSLDENSVMGRVDSSTVEEIFNNEKMKQFRLDLLNGKPRPEICSYCYDKENDNLDSYRTGQNHAWEYYTDAVLEKMEPDGYIDPKIRSWDIRYSNLCNLKCRSCGDLYSTTWSKEHADNGFADYVEHKAYDGEDPFENQYENVYTVYFAGGEPLIMPEHYQALKKLIERGTPKNIHLFYNSNMTKINYNKEYLPDYWKQFKDVMIGMSIDSFGDRANYIRHGAVKWKKIEENIKQLKKYSEENCNLTFDYSPTISVMNVYTITDMHRYLYDNGLMMSINDIKLVNILQYPHFYSIKLLPVYLKEEIQEKILKHVEWIKENGGNADVAKQFMNLLEYLGIKDEFVDREQHEKIFIMQTQKLDTIRNESFPDTFPEYKAWWEEITKNTIPVVNI